jgi:hypothetical protein
VWRNFVTVVWTYPHVGIEDLDSKQTFASVGRVCYPDVVLGDCVLVAKRQTNRHSPRTIQAVLAFKVAALPLKKTAKR